MQKGDGRTCFARSCPSLCQPRAVRRSRPCGGFLLHHGRWRPRCRSMRRLRALPLWTSCFGRGRRTPTYRCRGPIWPSRRHAMTGSTGPAFLVAARTVGVCLVYESPSRQPGITPVTTQDMVGVREASDHRKGLVAQLLLLCGHRFAAKGWAALHLTNCGVYIRGGVGDPSPANARPNCQ